MTIASGSIASTTPDNDGDKVRMEYRASGHYLVTVENADGDFQAAFVSREDMLAVARWVLKDEA